MPGTDGFALLTEIRTRRPDTPTLMITGHGDHALTMMPSAAEPTTSFRSRSTGILSLTSLHRAIQIAEQRRHVKGSSWYWSATRRLQQTVEKRTANCGKQRVLSRALEVVDRPDRKWRR